MNSNRWTMKHSSAPEYVNMDANNGGDKGYSNLGYYPKS
jgi:hypothetical protein